MCRLKLLILWIVAASLSVALLFPPFGYTGYKLLSMDPKAIASPQKFSVPWTYLTHKFIFEKPPGGDADFVDKMEQMKEMPLAFNVRIGWQFMVTECAVILLLGAVAFATVGKLTK